MNQFNLFVYGTLQRDGAAAHLLKGCRRIGEGVVGGTLYDIDGKYPALLLGGTAAVRGEIYSCDSALLLQLDEFEGVTEGLFRRVALMVGEHACWTYAAGPALSRKLTPARRIQTGVWRKPEAP